MVNPLVSVIIPTYNRLFKLAELIESLSRQSFKHFEIIIVNDAGESIDCIMRLYDELAIKIVDLETNQHHVKARNIGVSYAQGDWIMLVDDDDLLLPVHLEKMVKEMNGFDLIYSDVEIVNYYIENNIRKVQDRFLFAYELDVAAMKKFSTFVPSGCLFRKSIYEAIGGFDPEMRNYWDWDFFLRVAEQYRIKRVPVASVLYEFSDSGDNQSKQLTSMRTYLDRLIQKHDLGYLPTKNFFLLLEEPEVKAREAKSYVHWDGNPFISRLVSRQSTK